MIIPIKECPHCGNDYDFYTKDYISGSSQFNYKFDGSEADNSTMYEDLKHETGKYAYCGSCDKRLFKVKERE